MFNTCTCRNVCLIHVHVCRNVCLIPVHVCRNVCLIHVHVCRNVKYTECLTHCTQEATLVA